MNGHKSMKILVVDDTKENRYLLEIMLKGNGYEVLSAGNGLEALNKLVEDHFDMIISDILMPKMDGYRLCRECKKDNGLRKLPFVFLSAAYTEKRDEEFALSLGAERFIRKPIEPAEFMKIIEGVAKEYMGGTIPAQKAPSMKEVLYLSEYNERLVNKLEQEVRELENEIAMRKKTEEELEHLLISTITSLASAIDAKSPWTKGHSERVTRYAVEIAKEMGLKDQGIEQLRLSGLLHDVGKIGTFDIVLDKPGKLTDEEFEIVKKHPGKGAEILAPIRQLADIIPAVLHHHERYDGKGYPHGLKYEEIPLQARILCVADSFDSMTADRPYRSSPGKEYAISEFKRCCGTQFDPKVVDAFLRVLNRKREAAQSDE